MFALYTSIDSDVRSSLKFGGYDESAVAPGENLTWLHTKENDSWGLAAKFMIVFDETVRMEGNDPRVILIEPQMPYMYLPKAEFKHFAENLKNVYEDIKCKATFCYFEKSCENVNEPDEEKIRIQIFSPGTGDDFELKISLERLLVKNFDPKATQEDLDMCYLGVFPQNEGRQDVWYLGNLILAEYYLVFDMD